MYHLHSTVQVESVSARVNLGWSRLESAPLFLFTSRRNNIGSPTLKEW